MNANGCIEFKSDIGCARARWMGGGRPTGGPCHVELEVRDVVDWGEIERYAHPVERIEEDALGVRISGTVMEVDELGVLSLRLGRTLLLVDTEGMPPSDIVGASIAFRAKELQLYPECV